MLMIFFALCSLIYGSEAPAPPVKNYGPSMRDYPNPYELRILEKQSPCGENQIYDSCLPLYPPRRCNVKEVLTECGINPEPGSPSCQPGCRCADEYYLNISGDCITREECFLGTPKCTSRSLGYSECINGGCMKWRCTDYGYVCLVKGPCEVGCSCQDSYKRSPSGTCMPAEPCIPTDMASEITPPATILLPPKRPPKSAQQPTYMPYSKISKSQIEETSF